MTSFYNLDDVQGAMVSSLYGEFSRPNTDDIDLSRFVKKNARAKANINKALFGEEDIFTKTISLVPTNSRIASAFEGSISTLTSLSSAYDIPICFDTIKNNTLPDGSKFSRFLLRKMGDKKQDYVGKVAYMNDIRRELPNLPKESPSIENFIQNFYSGLASFRANIVISTHIADILTASEFCTFSSCYRFDGAYSSSTMVRALDRHTAMVFLVNSNSNRKIARFWIMLSDNGLQFVTFPSYGDLSIPNHDKAVSHIQQAIASNLGIDNRWEEGDFRRHEFDEEGDFFGGNAYVDIPTKAYKHVSQDHHAFNVNWPDPLCVNCGDSHNSDYLLCDDCKDNLSTCDNCYDRIDRDEECYDEETGQTLCQSCYDALFTTCRDCGERIRVGSDNDFTDDYRHYCEDCYYERFTTCEHCDNTCQRDDMTQVNDQNICSDCLRDYFTECDNCGEYFQNEDIAEFATGEALCNDCTKEKYADDESGFFLAQVIAIMREETVYHVQDMSFSRGIGRRHRAKVGDFIVAYDYEKNTRLYEINAVWIPSYSRKEFDGKTALKITLLASEKDIYSDAVYILDKDGREIRIEPDCIKHHIPAKDYYSTIQHNVASALLFDDCFYDMDHMSFPVNMGIMPCVACPRVGQYARLYPAAICEEMPVHYVSVLSSMVERMNSERFFEVLDVLDNSENELIRLRDGGQEYVYDIRWICSVRD